ncbi:MAG: endonuclease [Bacteroidetes bacterium]|nr:endonuclease [Bacteroidota bacterium]
MKFELKKYNRNISDQDLLDDLTRVAHQLNKDKLTANEYSQTGKYSSQTYKDRFGSWNRALAKVGIEATVKYNISDIELFENLERVWIKIGQQTRKRDLKRPLSKFSEGPYVTRFGTYMNALRAFVEFINTDVPESEDNIVETKPKEEIVIKHKTKRNPSERLKVQVLMRDGNKCKLCGVTVTGDSIHFDHIFPWSKGGETILENLQVLCEHHNLAKGNLQY